MLVESTIHNHSEMDCLMIQQMVQARANKKNRRQSEVRREALLEFIMKELLARSEERTNTADGN